MNKVGSKGLPQLTDTSPGSEERILVLMARAEQGVELHHPQDQKCGGLIPVRSLDETKCKVHAR